MSDAHAHHDHGPDCDHDHGPDLRLLVGAALATIALTVLVARRRRRR
jgi:MYXO-CTERM domain-containing protein